MSNPSGENHRLRGVIFDIDGVLTYQGMVFPDAVRVVQTLRERGVLLRFLTNSTLKSRASAVEKLVKAGFAVFLDEMITASSATAEYLRSLAPRSCWVMLDREGRDEFRDFVHDEENPEYIVVGDNRSQFDFDHLNKALRLLVKGAKLIGMQAEVLDSSMGDLELNVGAWVGMLERASGVQATYIGKPNPFVFELAMRGLCMPKQDVLVVGDRLATDVAGAHNFGLRAALIKTGEFAVDDLRSDIQPDYVFDEIGGLLSLFGA